MSSQAGEANPALLNALKTVFAKKLNAVAAKAQRKVPKPDGLDLNEVRAGQRNAETEPPPRPIIR